MTQFKFLIFFLSLVPSAPTLSAQVTDFTPLTEERLLDPSPNDWVMFSRTYDSQRYSPLSQLNRETVGQLGLVWARGIGPGIHEHIPLVYRGVMYVADPGAIIRALDATTGDLLWEYRRRLPRDLTDFINRVERVRNIAMYGDLIFYAAPDGFLVALDARTGQVRWETQAHDYKANTQHTSGPMVAGDKVVTGRSCRTQSECYIAAHDARTGRELWKFFVTAAPGDPGGDTWGDMPSEERVASPWGLPGSYDPERNLIYWGVANPRPYTRLSRHKGNVDAVSRSAPAELYSNSTVALNADTGELAWYYQHLPGDDWDADHTQERILFRALFDPDPGSVKWINPGIDRGQERDMVVSVGEPGGIWVNDRERGEFLWSTPFPYDVPEYHISHIDVETGKTHLNWDLVFQKDGDRRLICFENTKSYWPMAYHPGKNSLYVQYHDSCLDAVADSSTSNGQTSRRGVPRPGSNPNAFAGIAKVEMSTGRIQRLFEQRNPGNGALLATGGGLLFWGDMNRRLKAIDADTGVVYWEGIVGGIIQMSTITYAVEGKQYVAVLTGDGAGGSREPLEQVPELKTPRGHNAIYAFALLD